MMSYVSLRAVLMWQKKIRTCCRHAIFFFETKYTDSYLNKKEFNRRHADVEWRIHLDNEPADASGREMDLRYRKIRAHDPSSTARKVVPSPHKKSLMPF